jgi:MoCo/4Fe-4S cofactor protein with predicted Tat translocation signal
MSQRKHLAAELERLESLQGTVGRKYWRSLDELAATPAFQQLMRQEFPQQADIWPDSLSRRHFLSLMGASLALAGLSGCSVKPAPMGKIVPYVTPPPTLVAGEPLFFATAQALPGGAVGLLVESHMGRPTKIEGNPQHPASGGATSVYHQASILTLYDPDRSQTVTYQGRTRAWSEAVVTLRAALAKERDNGGAAVRILSEPIRSPTLARQRDEFLKAFPQAKWHVYEPLPQDARLAAIKQAFGQDLDCHYALKEADVVLSLDADFLGSEPGNLRSIADFMSRRRIRTSLRGAGDATMNRLYCVETELTCTGAKADHRLAVRVQDVEEFARALAAKLGVLKGDAGQATEASARDPHGKWIAALAKDLESHRGRAVVIAGNRQPLAVHLLALAINEHLENVGKTVFFATPPTFGPPARIDSLKQLADDMRQDRVKVLVILDANPVYSAHADLKFAEALERVPLRVHLGLYRDETARRCQWHINQAHFLETWGDALAFDGTATVQQPLIEPLYRGRSAIELVFLLATMHEMPVEELVRGYWRDVFNRRTGGPKGDAAFDEFWKTSLHDGVVAGTGTAHKGVQLADDWQRHLPPASNAPGSNAPAASANASGTYELSFAPDPTIYDGSFANNGWLQECPKPSTTLTWDNAALMSPKTAKQLGIEFGEYAHGGEHGGFLMPVVELKFDGRSVLAPAWIVPGQADGSITLHFGYGREFAGRVGGQGDERVGVNGYALRTAANPWFIPGVQVTKTDRTHLLACTQEHNVMENRALVRSATLEEYHHKPDFAAEPDRIRESHETLRAPAPLDFYPDFDATPPKHKWGMVIDLTTCVGCKACVVACQAENNIPVVGKEQVAAGREMHWLRVDRYVSGAPEEPQEFHFQPVPCMHCERAPCEYVCPVEATVHSAEGLNDMVYNRCVGTRFCSNNCSYKVRRFNFFHYADYETVSLKLLYNPDVTVRSRGVMEKCSYCVQRIRHAQIDADRDDRPIADGEVVTACQAACPAGAIAFGDLNNASAEATTWKNSPLNYALLQELGTRPRTTYLAAVRNPNPEMEGA